MSVKNKNPKLEMKIRTKGQERCNLEGRKDVTKTVEWLWGRQTWREMDSHIIYVK